MTDLKLIAVAIWVVLSALFAVAIFCGMRVRFYPSPLSAQHLKEMTMANITDTDRTAARSFTQVQSPLAGELAERFADRALIERKAIIAYLRQNWNDDDWGAYFADRIEAGDHLVQPTGQDD
jgi:hypothetical protein